MNIVGASGSAILVTGSSVAKFEIQFPSWSVNDQKNYYPYSVAAKLQTSYYPPKYNRTIFVSGSLAGGTYSSIITAPNGNMYTIPGSATGSVKFNSSGAVETFTYITTSSISVPSAGTKFLGAALAPNGCIYMVPYGSYQNNDYSSNNLVKINTNTDTISVIGTVPTMYQALGGYSGADFSNAILAPNGYIYGIPLRNIYILKINPNDDTYSTFGSFSTDNINFNPYRWGGVLAGNGCIYCAPYYLPYIIKIDTNTDKIDYISVPGYNNGSYGWRGGVLAPNNGCVYFTPYAATHVLKLNPVNDQITLINIGSAVYASNATITPEGLIYATRDSSGAIIINPFNDTITIFYGNSSFSKGNLGYNGTIYSITGQNLVKIKSNQSFDLDTNYVLSRYRNYV